MYHKILIATDLSESANHKIKKVLSLIKAEQTEVHLVHIIEPIPSYTMGSPFTEIGQAGIEDTKKAMAILGKFLHVPLANQHIQTGHAKRTILSFTEDIQCDLVIVASHSKKGFSKLLGSTANAIANQVKCDVIILRSYH